MLPGAIEKETLAWVCKFRCSFVFLKKTRDKSQDHMELAAASLNVLGKRPLSHIRRGLLSGSSARHKHWCSWLAWVQKGPGLSGPGILNHVDSTVSFHGQGGQLFSGTQKLTHVGIPHQTGKFWPQIPPNCILRASCVHLWDTFSKEFVPTTFSPKNK